MDHIGGVAGLKQRKPEAKIIIHPADEAIYEQLPNQPAWIGIPRSQWDELGFVYEAPPKADEHWSDGQTYKVGELSFRVIHCPGHTPGHVVLFEPDKKKVFVGDCLFAGSIGRTDLPGGSHATLIDSIKTKLLPLGDDVGFICGHGAGSSIGQERMTNPFITGEM
jgi:glyoxylase-like metal-dependent hydrolase (beta-lactamase superfamily II)